MRLLLDSRSVSRMLAAHPVVRRIPTRKLRKEPPAIVPLPNGQKTGGIRGRRGAILGEWIRGFNQENDDSAKKILSPKSVDISVDSVPVGCEQRR
jgi:hypothetical protein